MEAPYKVQLDAENARELAVHGTSLMLLDVPQSLSFGIDLQMFVVGPNFSGMKMIPPGPHFVYYSATSKEGGTGPVTGFFIYATQSQVIVRRWDAENEVFTKLSDTAEEERYAHAVRNFEFDKKLAPYDIHHFKQWQELSKYITTSVIERFEPVGGDISVIAEAELVEKHPQTVAERRMIDHIIKAREKHDRKSESCYQCHERRTSAGRCFYTRFPRLVKRSGADAQDLTSLNLDKSEVLEMVLKDYYGENEEFLLGELQFCYIAFLMGQSLESFGQWKSIVSLLLSCQLAPLKSRTRLFTQFMAVLYHQMKQGLKHNEPGTQLEDSSWFTEDNFFRLLAKDFMVMLKNSQPVDGELLNQARRLKELLEKSLGWDLDNEVGNLDNIDDEYAPIVVTEEQEFA